MSGCDFFLGVLAQGGIMRKALLAMSWPVLQKRRFHEESQSQEQKPLASKLMVAQEEFHFRHLNGQNEKSAHERIQELMPLSDLRKLVL